MARDAWRTSIELLREPAGPRRLAAETVTLGVTAPGDVVLQTYAFGFGLQRFSGENVNEVTSTYTVAAADVPRLLAAALRDLFPDTAALQQWLAARGIAATSGEWHGYYVRPVDEDRLLIAALRDLIGTVEGFDEGEKIAMRFLAWLRRASIGFVFAELPAER
jgi:hypothetical protein